VAKLVEQSGHQTKPTLPDLNRSAEKNIDFLKERSLRLFSQTVSTERSRDLVNCLVSYDVYSHDHNHILIPSGAASWAMYALLKALAKVVSPVTFHRASCRTVSAWTSINSEALIRSAKRAPGSGKSHYYKFSARPLLFGMIAGLSQSNTNYGTSEPATDVYDRVSRAACLNLRRTFSTNPEHFADIHDSRRQRIKNLLAR